MSSQITLLESILTSSRTVFTTQSLALLTGADDSARLAKSLHYYVSQGRLGNPRRGIYTKAGYDEREMACALFHPSYISLEYVLQQAGVVFQYSEAVTCVSYLARSVEVDGRDYTFRKIAGSIWAGMDGIRMEDNIAIATPERAFLDMVYLSAGNCYFDNLRPLNHKRITALLPRYGSARLAERVDKILSRR